MSNQFEVRQPKYLKQFSAFRNSTSLEHIAKSIGHSKKRKNLRVADMMCGTGAVGHFLGEYFGTETIERLIFIDASIKMLKEIEGNVEKVRAYAENLPFDEKYFDIMVCRYGLNNIQREQYVPILKEYIRTLSEEGVLTIQDHFPKSFADAEALNEIEKFIAVQDGRNDNPYIPPIDFFKEIVAYMGGRVIDVTEFGYNWSLRDRLLSKDKGVVDIGEIKQSLLGCTPTDIKMDFTDDDLLITYPITTFSIERS
jgi:ubiquinone/menaquinone biosynthesis C-methylase UbiE